MPRSFAACSGSFEFPTVPNGVSIFTLSPFCETLACLIARWMTMPQVTIARIAMNTRTATTMRMILSALLPPFAGGAETGGAVTGVADAGGAATAAPHLLQNFVSGVRLAPQELQNAINHLVCTEMNRTPSISQFFSLKNAGTAAPIRYFLLKRRRAPGNEAQLTSQPEGNNNDGCRSRGQGTRDRPRKSTACRNPPSTAQAE